MKLNLIQCGKKKYEENLYTIKYNYKKYYLGYIKILLIIK